MKRFLLIVFIVLAQATTWAQNSKLIIGKWAFESLQDDGKSDEQTKQMTNMMFKDLTMNFRTDNTMSLQLKKKPEPAKYSFDKSDDKIINAVSENGKAMTLTIIKLTKDELVINMDKGGIFNLKKVSDTPDAVVVKAAVTTVAATAKQLTAKWNLVDMEKEKKSELFYELIKGSYIQFFEDGTYHTKILSIEEDGEWELTQGRTVIEVETEDDKGFWNILSISDTELTMQRGSEGKKYSFKKAAE